MRACGWCAHCWPGGWLGFSAFTKGLRAALLRPTALVLAAGAALVRAAAAGTVLARAAALARAAGAVLTAGAALAAGTLLAPGAAMAQNSTPWPRIGARLTAGGLKADVSFLASDALEGRGTPSRGLDIAAQYIADQFRRAGLVPAGDDGYFQTASFESVTPNPEGLAFTLEVGGRSLQASGVSVHSAAALDLSHAAAVKIAATLPALPAEPVRGKVLLVEGRGPAAQLAARSQAALVVLLREASRAGGESPRLREAGADTAPVLVVTDEAIRRAVAAMRAGPVEATVSAHMGAPGIAPVKLRNVAGVLPGADPLLKDTCVVLTAHYDHLGTRGTGERDRIYHGANDDASGTASVIEVAKALAGLDRRPKRSILFLALFGEELGELGSRYYAAHPLVPLARTLVDLNLEQLGRTDETGEGNKLRQLDLTGFDLTNLAAIFEPYAKRAGVKLVDDRTKSDAYFLRSDNAAFAAAGVPSTTLLVTYVFGDYHQPGDEWRKLNYDNMARVDRAIALAVYGIADGVEEPRWNVQNPTTGPYRLAREAQR